MTREHDRCPVCHQLGDWCACPIEPPLVDYRWLWAAACVASCLIGYLAGAAPIFM